MEKSRPVVGGFVAPAEINPLNNIPTLPLQGDAAERYSAKKVVGIVGQVL